MRVYKTIYMEVPEAELDRICAKADRALGLMDDTFDLPKVDQDNEWEVDQEGSC